MLDTDMLYIHQLHVVKFIHRLQTVTCILNIQAPYLLDCHVVYNSWTKNYEDVSASK